MNRLKTTGVVLGVSMLARQYFATGGSADDRQVAACPVHHTEHMVTIWQNELHPAHTTAQLCDTLTITNADNTIRLMAFGAHDHHVPYDDITEQVLGRGQSLTLTLNQLGTYHYHDHLHDEIVGDFTVSE